MVSESKSQHANSVELPMMGDPSAAFGDCVSSLAKVVTVAVEFEMERVDLRPLEFAVMQLFCQQPDWTATQLTKRLSLDPSSMSRVVDQLVNRCLLRRRRSRTDRRVVNLLLTDSGSEIIAEAHTRIISYQADLLKDVSDEELRGFFATGRKVIQNYTDLARDQSQVSG
ncbi:MAG: winged helix-turn-helix transcriptional regulator [Acidimicrobiia bacterium]|nr:winged helix-turn-helix transcriptional regulator [Acidimicrobiia bacterium]MYG72009.1 winged helix-turn-helix transcriptional regulator [Acidimicrobiia bacterium]